MSPLSSAMKLTLWLVIRICDSLTTKASRLILAAAGVAITPPAPTLMTPLHKSTSCCGAVDSWRLTNPPPTSLRHHHHHHLWVPSRSSGESSAQQRARRREGGNWSGKRVVHSGFKAPSPRPLALLSPLTVFPRAPDPSRPRTPAALRQSMATVTLVTSVQLFDYECLILWDRIASCLCTWPETFLFCVSCGCVYLKQPAWISAPLPSFDSSDVSWRFSPLARCSVLRLFLLWLNFKFTFGSIRNNQLDLFLCPTCNLASWKVTNSAFILFKTDLNYWY